MRVSSLSLAFAIIYVMVIINAPVTKAKAVFGADSKILMSPFDDMIKPIQPYISQLDKLIAAYPELGNFIRPMMAALKGYRNV
ncbi:uncharacterized protein LOC118644678 [Monomorium pharaonis]|uniref:uncharacterized protein LOC118644678 n=1 Tax=Monomorium pharaonis TaxID=307658 RepID=UPI0017473B74|nr:uncharacterized protein LOC118644678 [Monomorium pharaonis]